LANLRQREISGKHDSSAIEIYNKLRFHLNTNDNSKAPAILTAYLRGKQKISRIRVL